MADSTIFRLGSFDAGKYSMAEKQARQFHIARFCAGLVGQFRLLIYSRPYPLDEPLERLRTLMAEAPSARRREQIAAYRRFLEEIVRAAHLKDTQYYAVWFSDEASHILANDLTAGLQVPVQQVVALPDLVPGEYREMPGYYQPATRRQGLPYLTFCYSYDLRSHVDFNTLADFLRLPFPISIAVDVKTIPPDKAIGKLQMKSNELKADLIGRSGNEAPDPEKEQAYQDVLQALWNVQHYQVGVHQAVLVLAIEGQNPAELETNLGLVGSVARLKMIKLRPATAHQKDGFDVFGPEPTPAAIDRERRNLLSEGAAVVIAPSYQTDAGRQGPLVATNRATGSPLLVDKFSLPAHNEIILGKTGSGKTFTAGLIAYRSVLHNVQSVFLDPQGNFRKITLAVDGSYNYLRLGEGTAFNILDVVHDHPAAQVSHVLTLLEQILARGLDNRERGAVDGALLDLYHDCGVRVGEYHPEQMPRLEDLAVRLSGRRNGHSAPDLALDLERYVDGSLREIFNAYTTLNFDLDRKYPIITFDLSDLDDEFQGPFIFALLSSIERTIRQRRAQQLPTNIVLDEFGILSRIPTLASAAGKLAKRVRAWKVGIQPLDQNWMTFDNPAGREILENAQVKTIMRVDRTAAPAIVENLGLTDYHANVILNAGLGEGVMIVNNKPYHVYFQASPSEVRMLTPYTRTVEDALPLPMRQ